MSRTPTLPAPKPQLSLDQISNIFRSQLVKNATEEMSLLHKPGSTAKSIDWSKIAVREATTEEASTIAEWAKNPNEALWLGADEDRLEEITVRMWIEKSWGAFVLHETAEKGTPVQLVAFANVAPLDADSTEFRIEIGRLLVTPTHRRQGLGSTLVRHLTVAISKTIEEVFLNTAGRVPTLISTPPEINVRVMQGNDIALRLIERLPFSNTTSPLASLDPRYHWFKYLTGIRVGVTLGDAISQIRLQKKFSQAELAFRCGVQRTTINMIEQGKRNPSMELLRGLVANLASTPDEIRQIIYASIGEDPEQAPPKYLPLTRHAPPSNVDLWIFSDALAENILDSQWLKATIDDIKKKKIRYYFLPEGKCQSEKDQFRQALKDGGIDKGTYGSRVRFFALQEPSPALICLLRLAVINPHMGDSVDFIEIEADKRSRVPLSQDRASQVMLALNKVLKAVERGNLGDGYHGIREVKLDDEVKQDST